MHWEREREREIFLSLSMREETLFVLNVEMGILKQSDSMAVTFDCFVPLDSKKKKKYRSVKLNSNDWPSDTQDSKTNFSIQTFRLKKKGVQSSEIQLILWIFVFRIFFREKNHKNRVCEKQSKQKKNGHWIDYRGLTFHPFQGFIDWNQHVGLWKFWNNNLFASYWMIIVRVFGDGIKKKKDGEKLAIESIRRRRRSPPQPSSSITTKHHHRSICDSVVILTSRFLIWSDRFQIIITLELFG